jgi:long-chain acyl-CoA synthetase
LNPNFSTPLEHFAHWETTTPNHPFLRQPIDGQWKVYTYQEAGQEIRRIAAGLKTLNLPAQSSIAILSKNCAHWIMADLAIWMAGHVTVPIYQTLSANGVQQILELGHCKAIFVGKLDAYGEQKAGIPSEVTKISFPLYGPNEGLKWDDLLKNPPLMNISVDPEALATIMYSSGTTGTPKGAMITFKSFGYVGVKVATHLCLRTPQRYFSYLPLSHVAERTLLEMVALVTGSTISFAESLETFSKNIQEEKPTIFGGVPRIWSKFQEGVLEKIPQKKLDRLLSIPIVSTVIKKTIQKKLGLAHSKIFVSGAAPIPVSLLEWYRKIGIEVREVYGMTENTVLATANYLGVKFGTVGQAWPGCEVKVSAEGEILVRHPALMKGYYNDPKTTANVFTEDGFLKTGDKGELDSEGFLTITGRINDQFKTNKAKFIAPAPIEMKLLINKDIEQVCVVGMGIPQPIAMITLSLSGKSKSKDILTQSLRETLAEINRVLETYERVEKAIVLPESWTIENGLMTPTLKIKRVELERIYVSKYPEWYSHAETIVWC